MKSKNGKAVFFGILIFALLIAAAIVLQSAYLLYAATAVPILLVPFLPDLSSSQKLKPGRSSVPVRIYRTSPEVDAGLLVIEAAPGAIQWNKKKLIFSLEGVPVHSRAGSRDVSAGVPVLLYDLVKQGKKRNMYGIVLNHLKDRLNTMSYTTDEVTRLVIRMEDLISLDPANTAARARQVSKGLEA